LGIDTGKRPWIGISPNSALARLVAETTVFEYVQTYVWMPGIEPPVTALCVAPFGMEEGTEAVIPHGEFGLVVGEPAEFRFFTSAVRKNDDAGHLIEDFGDDLQELAPMEVNLPAQQDAADVVPVSFETVVTETGMLQLWCVARDGRRWKLEFNVRERIEA